MSNWDSELYDDKISFVSRLGLDVVRLLDPRPGERILDLGCGTGDLANEIVMEGAVPLGIDAAPSMIEKARVKYPDIAFEVGDGLTFRTAEQFDAVFSNAALHWMKPASSVVETIWLALRPGGRFVAEFGGLGNVETIFGAISDALADYGISAAQRNPCYFPSIGQYSTILENQGFQVVYALYFDRPTPLEDGHNGMRHWLDMFAGKFFEGISPSQKEYMYKKIKDLLRPSLFKNGTWIADNRRIRIKAVKL
ncbi:MAG: methyltransferase type 11 [Peptococcaceae bacterium BRH_c4a]|nr:MAG: methyltransferase type 11 [Peptococcaceae bacterium BRH_c4a]